MQKKSETLKYERGMSRQEGLQIFKAVAIPFIVFWLQVFTVNTYAQFGTKIISPASAIMWIVGFAVALFMPSERYEVLRQTMSFCAIYCLVLLALHLALGMVSGASSEMIAASFDQTIPTTTGNALPGYLSTFIWFTSIGIPIAHIGMQGKRFFQFSKTKSLQQSFNRARDYRSSGKENTRGIK